ncbi:hypothetical protein K2173_004788 [Erythroxylum novogranatense]|uniref:Pectinesterase n=1 Tax=Erythroxylum novogranatense TaxID=1862640 RepID=A0AAV8SJV3_9ROSI|nr:hypothetical protein K2173_004788 [Erythroxylum novogranatense]
MAPKLSCLCTISLLLMFSFSPSHGINLSSEIFNSPETICSYTPHPSFCKYSLPNSKPGTIFDYSRNALGNSLSNARSFLSLIDNYLTLPSTSYESTIRALEDCRFLTQLIIDYLSETIEAVSTVDTLQSLEAAGFLAKLSATLTCQETCIDSLQNVASATNIRNALLGPLSNGIKHHSVSLALFIHGWIPDMGLLTESRNVFSNLEGGSTKRLPLTMLLKDRGLFNSVNGRRHLGESDNSILVSQIVVVDPYGAGDFTTISDAVAAAPNNTAIGNGYFVIYVVAGVYFEYVSIPKNKKYVLMIGDGINQTIITGNRSVDDGWTTFNSATFVVVGEGFVAVNMTFRNTAGAIKHQAVAVRNGADMSTFYKCSIEGYQDTLYAHSLRQFYRECDIYGTIDYIFGNAAVVFQNCNIYSRLPMTNQFNTITAQGRTDPNQNTGTSIQNCTIGAAQDLASSNGSTKTYLGRPWKDYSTTVFMESFLDSLIDPSGWAEWSGNQSLSTLYYAEFNNTGPGFNITNRVKWPGFHILNVTGARSFTVYRFIQGDSWLPATGVPYTGGLL